MRRLERLGIRRVRAAVDAAPIDEGDPAGALRRLIDEAAPLTGFLGFLMSENQLLEPSGHDPGRNEIDDRIPALFRRARRPGPSASISPPLPHRSSLRPGHGIGPGAQEGRVAERDAGRLTAELLLGGLLRRAPR